MMIRKSRIFVLITFLIWICTMDREAAGAGEWVFYVAPDGDDTASGRTLEEPFATLQRARDAIREIGELKSPVTVYLRGGTYELREPFVLGPEDSGTEAYPITYAAYEEEQPVLSGGRRIRGWKKGEKGIWQVEIPEVKQGEWKFRQLYVEGKLRQRARVPKDGFLRVAGFPDGGREVHYHTDCQRFEFAPGDIDSEWTNIEDVEVIVYHFWTDSHLPIQSIDTETNIVTFAHKAGKVFTDGFADGGARYVVENVYEGLDRPGEWYLNRKTGVLSYLPMDGEEMDQVEVIAPVIAEFVRFEGEPIERRLVEQVHFRGLSFAYTNWELPPGNSNERQGSASVPACISMRGAVDCVFERCSVRNTGTAAFEIGRGCRGNRFVGNEIGYVAAGGFRIDGGTEDHHPLLRTRENVISDNHLHHYGEVYPSAVGILLGDTSGNRVVHNHVHHGWYTGISSGLSWGYHRSVSRDNRIEFNYIHDIGQGLLSDMGGIYTLGVSPGTTIRNNLIHDVEANQYGGWGIYNDEGSSHILVENNVVYRTNFGGYNIHYSKEVTVRNNIFALARINQLSRSRVDPHKSVFFENNIIYWTEGELLSGNWQDEPYEFHFRPYGENGTRTVESSFDMDWNLYFNPHLQAEELRFGEERLEEWQARGKDVHSLFADPLFADPEKGDFRLGGDSPAFDMGFRPIDLERVGPRPVDYSE
jgi:hypothetical protein